MSNNVKVIGVKFNEGATDLAIFTSEELAKQHIRTTFKNMGYDRLFTRPVAKTNKDAILIPEEIASNQGTYAVTKAIMEMLDWSKIKTETKFGTLTEFMLPENDILKTKTQVDKLTNVGIEDEDSEGNVISVSLQVVHGEDTPLPYKRIIRQLQKELENILIGADDVTEESEGVVEEETSEEHTDESDIFEKAIEKSKEEAKRFAREEANKLDEQKRLEEAKAEKERLAREKAEQEAKRIADEEAFSEEEAKRLEEEAAKEEAEKEAKRIADEKAKAEQEAKEKAEKEEAEKEAERIADEKAKASRPSPKIDLSSLDGIDL